MAPVARRRTRSLSDLGAETHVPGVATGHCRLCVTRRAQLTRVRREGRTWGASRGRVAGPMEGSEVVSVFNSFKTAMRTVFACTPQTPGGWDLPRAPRSQPTPASQLVLLRRASSRAGRRPASSVRHDPGDCERGRTRCRRGVAGDGRVGSRGEGLCRARPTRAGVLGLREGRPGACAFTLRGERPPCPEITHNKK